VSDRLFNRLHVYARSLFLAGAGLAIMGLGSAAMAQDVVKGKQLYSDKLCAACHLPDPTFNRDNILSGANDPQRILQECATEPSMVPFCSTGKAFVLSLQEATDIAAFIANPNAEVAAISVDRTDLSFRRSINNGASARQKVTVSNPGGANLVLTTVALAGTNPGDYQLQNPAAGTACVSGTTVAAGANCSIDVVFDPTVAGARNATLVFTPDGVAPATVTLSGVGTANAEPFATADVAALNFGSQLISTASGAKTLIVTNNGDANLTFDAANAFVLAGGNAADFAVDGGTCAAGGSVNAEGGSCTITLKFTPAAVGNRTATLTVGSNGQDLVVNLAGNGQAANNNEGEAGCSTINPNAAFDPMLLSLLAAALAVMGLRRRQR
jgi:hypothetical protein